jgi:hypothetical protein
MNRRNALKNMGLLTGGLTLIPYSCSLTPELVFKRLANVKKEQQDLIGWVCNCILPEDLENFPTPESRQFFVLTQINDCESTEIILRFLKGLESFQLALSPTKEIKIDWLTPEEQFVFLSLQFEKKGAIKIFLEMLKNYSLLHFETSENYMKNYLDFEFMPGRYIGDVTV